MEISPLVWLLVSMGKLWNAGGNKSFKSPSKNFSDSCKLDAVCLESQTCANCCFNAINLQKNQMYINKNRKLSQVQTARAAELQRITSFGHTFISWFIRQPVRARESDLIHQIYWSLYPPYHLALANAVVWRDSLDA